MGPRRSLSPARLGCAITPRPSRRSTRGDGSHSRKLSSAPRRARPRSCTRAAASSVEGSSPPRLERPPDLVAAAFHWLGYLGLLGGIGALLGRRVGRLRPRVLWA